MFAREATDELATQPEPEGRSLQLAAAYTALRQAGPMREPELLAVANQWRDTAGLGLWDAHKVRRLLAKLSLTPDGAITPNDFVLLFDKMLPLDPVEFERVLARWRQMAPAQAAPAQPVPVRVEQSGASERRVLQLQFVFREFDLDGNGTIEASELLELGKTRRAMGQRQDLWSPEKNMRAVARMDTDGDGRVSMSEFVKHYEKVLPRDPDEFDAEIENFMGVARNCRARLAQRQEQHLSRKSVRLGKLEEVFSALDRSGTGRVSASELLELANGEGSWTPGKNMRAVAQLDTDLAGCVSQHQFVTQYERVSDTAAWAADVVGQVLPVGELEFDHEVAGFLQIASARGKSSPRSKPALTVSVPPHGADDPNQVRAACWCVLSAIQVSFSPVGLGSPASDYAEDVDERTGVAEEAAAYSRLAGSLGDKLANKYSPVRHWGMTYGGRGSGMPVYEWLKQHSLEQYAGKLQAEGFETLDSLSQLSDQAQADASCADGRDRT